jgi:hypothetical protein
MAKVIEYDIKVDGADKGLSELDKIDNKAEQLDKSLEKAIKTSDDINKVGAAIAGAFGIATGAVGAFGDSLGFTSEQVQEAQEKAQSFVLILTQLKPVVEGAVSAWKLLNLALAANPIGLVVGVVAALVVGIVALIAAWDDLTGELGIVEQAQQQLIDSTKELSEEQKKLTEENNKNTSKILIDGKRKRDAINEEIRATERARKAIDDRYAAEIAAARAAGKATGQLEESKRKEIIATNREAVRAIEAQVQNAVTTLALSKRISEAQAIELIKNDALFGRIYESVQKRINELNNEIGDAIEKQTVVTQKQRETIPDMEKVASISGTLNKNLLTDLATARGETFSLFDLIAQQQLKAQEEDERLRLEAIENARLERDAKIQFAQDTFSVVSSIGDLLTAAGVENVGLQKTIALAQIAFDTGKAISGAIAQAQSVPFPANIAAIATGVAAVITGISQAITALNSAPQVAGASGGGSSVSLPSLPRPDVTSQAFNSPSPANTANAPQRVFVLQSDIAGVSNKVNVAESLSRF